MKISLSNALVIAVILCLAGYANAESSAGQADNAGESKGRKVVPKNLDPELIAGDRLLISSDWRPTAPVEAQLWNKSELVVTGEIMGDEVGVSTEKGITRYSDVPTLVTSVFKGDKALEGRSVHATIWVIARPGEGFLSPAKGEKYILFLNSERRGDDSTWVTPQEPLVIQPATRQIAASLKKLAADQAGAADAQAIDYQKHDPLRVLELLAASKLDFVQISNAPKGWITREHVAKLMLKLDSAEPCGGIHSDRDPNIGGPEKPGQSTVGHEAGLMIESYRHGLYPMCFSYSIDWPIDKDALRTWWKTEPQ